MDANIVVGLSGGVDSSMSIVLLKEMGYEPIGLFLELPKWEMDCSSQEGLSVDQTQQKEMARQVCESEGIPFHSYDVRDSFHQIVIDYMKQDLKRGFTPNPCVICNRLLKFATLLKWASDHGVTKVATGHYARIIYDDNTNEYHLLKGKDPTKDQSYGLSYLTQEQLSKIILPLGETDKTDIFDKADSIGFTGFREKQESQDFCYVGGKDYRSFVEESVGTTPGDIVNREGNVIGMHKGLQFYTIGQKKGLNLPRRHYVMRKEPSTNRLIVTENYDDLLCAEIQLHDVNINCTLPSTEFKGEVVTRYHQQPTPATIIITNTTAKIKFDYPIGPISAGQFGVLYQGEQCLGGGIITPVSK